MYHPTRGGVRGGKDQFTWDQVKTDKDRECYLGHSLMAPIGRWQEGKDLTWYAKDDEPSSNKVAKVSNEFRRAKELEEEALMAALGYKVVKKEAKQPETLSSSSSHPTTESSQSTTTKQHKNFTEVKVKHGVSGPPKLIEFDDKKTLDALLLKLIQKHGLNELVEALSGGGGDKKGKSKKSKKNKGKKKKNGNKSKRDESSDDDSSEKSEYEEKEVSSGGKRKKGEKEARGNKKSKKREESSDDSSSSDSDTD